MHPYHRDCTNDSSEDVIDNYGNRSDDGFDDFWQGPNQRGNQRNTCIDNKGDGVDNRFEESLDDLRNRSHDGFYDFRQSTDNRSYELNACLDNLRNRTHNEIKERLYEARKCIKQNRYSVKNTLCQSRHYVIGLWGMI